MIELRSALTYAAPAHPLEIHLDVEVGDAVVIQKADDG